MRARQRWRKRHAHCDADRPDSWCNYRLFAHQLQEKFRYLYTWTEGDVLVWEHFGTLHRAVADYGPDEHRLMKRCQVLATAIFDPAFRQAMALDPVAA